MVDTVLTNTYTSVGPGTAALEHEKLSDIVEQVYREEAPLYNNLQKVEASGLRHDWGTEDIGAITLPTARSQGFVAAPTAPLTPVRYSNWCQLVAVEGGVSDTKEAIDTAGNVGSYEHQVMLKSAKMLRQLNKLAHANQAKDGSGEPYVTATIKTFLDDNYADVSGVAGTPPSGDGVTAYVAGTSPDDFDTIEPINTVLQSAYSSRGKPTAMYLHPARVADFSRLPDASIAENSQVGPPYEHIGTVDTYRSDFGMVERIIDLDADPTTILIVDHDFAAKAILPGMDFDEEELGRRGSGREFLVQWQGCFIVTLPQAHALITGYKTT
jgi:hypothetical protein